MFERRTTRRGRSLALLSALILALVAAALVVRTGTAGAAPSGRTLTYEAEELSWRTSPRRHPSRRKGTAASSGPATRSFSFAP